MKLIRSRILTFVSGEPKEVSEEEKMLLEAERIIKGLDYDEIRDNYEEYSTEFEFEDCAIDFDRELVFVRGNDGTTTIQPLSHDVVLEEDFDSLVSKYEYQNKNIVNKILTKIKLYTLKFFRMFAKEN